MKETIGFNNFKAFGEKMQRFSKKPITLVYGANSAGKSTFLHRELYMQYALDTNLFDVNKTTMFGDEIDFGGFDRFIHKRDPQKEICLHFETDGFEEQYDGNEWKQFYLYTKEMQEDLLKKIEALSEEECKMSVLNIPTLENIFDGSPFGSYSFAFDVNNLDLEQTKGTQFETYRDISGKIFNPRGIGEAKQYIKLAVPVLNPSFLREASLLLDKTITIDDCKSLTQASTIFESLKMLSLKEVIDNNKNVNTVVSKNRVALAKKFLKNNIKPEWLCLTRIPLIPLKNDTGYGMERINEQLKTQKKAEAPWIILSSNYEALVQEVYLVLFSQGYDDPISKIAVILIWSSLFEWSPEELGLDSWNYYDFSQREKVFVWFDKKTNSYKFKEQGITSYKELLLSECKSIFKRNEARRLIDLDIYIGETNHKIDIKNINIRLDNQRFSSVSYVGSETYKITYNLSPEKQENKFSEQRQDIIENGFLVKHVKTSFFEAIDKENIPYKEIFEAAKRLLYKHNKETHYIGPLRDYPSREDAFMVNDEVSPNNVMVQLRNNPKIRDVVNQWFASNEKLRLPYEVIERKLVDIEALYENDKHFSKIHELGDIKLIVEYIKEHTEGLKEITFIDKRTNTPVHNRDMGLGVTQILPIIITSNTANDAQIVIEQPELHLHPALQCELADEFIRSYKENGNSFLIESHSEHMLLRIMKRMRHTAEGKLDKDDVLALTPDDVCLLYVDGDGEKTWVNELELDTDGTLLDPWPHGFFEEGYKERFE